MKLYMVCMLTLVSATHAVWSEIVSQKDVQNLLSTIEQEAYDRRAWLQRQPLFDRDGQPLETSRDYVIALPPISRNVQGIAHAYNLNIDAAVPYIRTPHEQPDRYANRHHAEDRLAHIERQVAWLKDQLATRAVLCAWYEDMQAYYKDIARLGRGLKRDIESRKAGATIE